MADCEDESVSEARERSRSCSNGQRPKPKPRKRVGKSQSILGYTGSRDQPVATTLISVDPSPQQLARETNNRRSLSYSVKGLQHTPLVTARSITNQPKSSLNHSTENSKQGYGSRYDLQRGDETNSTENLKGSKYKGSPVIRRERAVSEPKNQTCPPRPPRPSHPPPPNPRLSKLISDHHPVHVIDSRSKVKTPPVIGRPVTAPPPRPPAPPLPKARQEEAKDSPQVENLTNISIIPNPQTLSLLKSKHPNTLNHDSVSSLPSEHEKRQENDGIKEKGDRSVPVYEDLDKDNDSCDLSSDKELPLSLHTVSSCSDAVSPPALPPKKRSEVKQSNEEELVPPLPPRSLPRKSVRKHGLLINGSEVLTTEKESEEEDEQALHETGDYEPVNYHETDKGSQESDDSYTEMHDPGHSDDDLGKKDEPSEDIYITMDPHSYIQPPANYKPKKKKKKKKRTIGHKNDCKVE